ncbi:MAG: glycosyltransferase 87 family protein [Solirubrobacterales bacterium]
MAWRERGLALLIVALIHIAAFAPTIGSGSSILKRGFWPQSEAILGGEVPYAEVNFEYPPLALPLVVGPAKVSEGLDGYERAFELEMLGFDLAIVAVLALAMPGTRRRVLESLGIYTVGVVAVSGVVLGGSAIEAAPLALARFDLAVALLILGAVLAREAQRTELWSLLLGTATAVKAFPALLFPNLVRGERDPARAAYAALVPIAIAVGIVLGFGDEFGSAVTYHTERDLQIETLGATPLLLSHLLFGSEAQTIVGAGGFNLSAPGAGLARAISIGLTLGSVAVLIHAGWRRRTPPLVISTAILAAVIAFAPVLSPQFLLWVLPLSAVAYGLGRENLVLIACFVLTEIVLHHYVGVEELSGDFVWPLAARNALLLAYLALVVIPVFRPADAYPQPDG